MTSRLLGQGRSAILFAAVFGATGVSPSTAAAGHHKHGVKYDVVQGYIIQSPAAVVPSQPVVNPSAQPVGPGATYGTPQSQGLTVAAPQPQAPQPSAPPVQLQAAPAPAPALQAVPLTYVPMVQLAAAPAPAPVQLQLAAPSPVPVQLQLAAAPTQVHYVTLQAAQAPTVALAAPSQLAAQNVSVLTPVQILIPHRHGCHLFGK